MFRIKSKKHPKVLVIAAILLVTLCSMYLIDNDILVIKSQLNQDYAKYGINIQQNFLQHKEEINEINDNLKKNISKKDSNLKISKDSSETKKTTTIVPLKDVSQLIDDPSNRKLSALKIKTNPPMNNKNTAKDKALNLTNQSFINENKILNLNNNNTMKEKNAISTNKIINPNEISHSLKDVKQSQKSTIKENKEKVIKNENNKPIKTTSELKKKALNNTKIQTSNKAQVQKQTIIESSYDDNSWRKVNVKLNNFLKQRTPPNKNFVFHNKMPKCGSSTMNNVLKICSENKKYNFEKIAAWNISMYDDRLLVNHINKNTSPPYLLLKHHFYFDFKKFGSQQPTYINVIRDPLDWFTSRYYFARYGWARKPGCRKWENCKELDINMTIDECVEKRHPACTNSTYQYLPFLCGKEDDCINTTLKAKERAFEISKKHILNNYFFIGILEQFEETLLLAEFLLPEFYKNASNIWKSDLIQEKQLGTKTRNKKVMNEKSRKFFLEGPLKYEKKLYDFCRKLFNERLKYFKININ